MTESEPTEDSKKDIKKSVGHIKMIVIANLRAQTIDVEVTENIDKNASLTTDDSTSYVHFKNLVKEHTAQVINPKEISKVLPWVHIMISNAKRQLLDIYYKKSKNHIKENLQKSLSQYKQKPSS